MNTRSKLELSLTIPRTSTPSFSSPPPKTSTHSPTKSMSSQISFSKLEHICRISGGSSSTVYKVLHHPTGQLYALRTLNTNTDNNQLRHHFLRDIKLLRHVNHPNLVNCHNFFNQDGQFHLLFDYVERGSLKGCHVENEEKLANITSQVLSALSYLHTRKLVHRDLKPSNLLINNLEVVKISDFSLSMVLRHTILTSEIAYMSPERISTDIFRGLYDGYAGDIWSFGLCILEVYLGVYPFEVGLDPDWGSLMAAICGPKTPVAPPAASMEFRDFIKCCLQRDPTKRWSANQLLLHPFVAQISQDCNPKY